MAEASCSVQKVTTGDYLFQKWFPTCRQTNGRNISMGNNVTSAEYAEYRSDALHSSTEAHSSGAAWGAVIGGAFVSAAVCLILLALGTGFGLSAVSPWSNVGVSASTVSTGAIIWLIL